MNSVLIDSDEGREALARLAAEHDVDGDLLVELLLLVGRHSGMLRRRGLFQQLDVLLADED